MGGHQVSASLTAHRGTHRDSKVPPSPLPAMPAACSPALSLGSQGTGSGVCLGVVTAAVPALGMRTPGPHPSYALHQAPHGPAGRDQLHLQTWRMRGGWRRRARWELKPRRCPALLLPQRTRRAPSWGQDSVMGPWCPQLPPDQAEQEAEGLGPTRGVPGTHGWHVPLPAPAPSNHHQGAPQGRAALRALGRRPPLHAECKRGARGRPPTRRTGARGSGRASTHRPGPTSGSWLQVTWGGR